MWAPQRRLLAAGLLLLSVERPPTAAAAGIALRVLWLSLRQPACNRLVLGKGGVYCSMYRTYMLQTANL